MKKYSVKEIFGPTVQGEGSFAGTAVKFLRFAGCNRWSGRDEDRESSICKFCDTDFRGGDKLSAEEILGRLDALGPVRRVVMTGGEPCLQLDRHVLSVLREGGYTLHLETNGSLPLGELLPLVDHISLSPKQGKNDTKLELCHDLKILYPPIHPEITTEGFREYEATNRYLQPVWDGAYESNLASTLAKVYEQPQWRVSLQTHKMIGVQ
jgi:7-carboxy-7-deazaguanine synthase